MFNGAHFVIYSKDAVADREFLLNVVGLTSVDAGDGWLIFALPPSEVAVHPHSSSSAHEIYFMCDDIEAARGELSSKGAECSETVDEGWGLLSSLTLPGGGRIGFYQPRHARPTLPDQNFNKTGRES